MRLAGELAKGSFCSDVSHWNPCRASLAIENAIKLDSGEKVAATVVVSIAQRRTPALSRTEFNRAGFALLNYSRMDIARALKLAQL